MPARKPSTLTGRHDTKADRAQRTASESAMTPRTELTRKPPAALTGHKIAVAAWKRTIGLYAELEGKIATSFDEDLLIEYCFVKSELVELENMRREFVNDYTEQRKAARKIKLTAETKGEWAFMWNVVNGLKKALQGMDARLDGKRKLLHTMEMSLYLTPRSRAGVEPPTKEPEAPLSEMEKVLNG